jgi:hypothetical protein
MYSVQMQLLVTICDLQLVEYTDTESRCGVLTALPHNLQQTPQWWL